MKVKILDSRITSEMLRPATEGSAAIDLRACLQAPVVSYPSKTIGIGAGIAVAIPRGFAGIIIPRSGLGTKQGLILANGTGLIDADYRGEIKVMLWNRLEEAPAYTINPMDRIAQLFVIPVHNFITIVDELDTTTRGTGGFGSSGNK